MATWRRPAIRRSAAEREVGKFVTRTNDYFFRPAAAVIYLLFAALLSVAGLIDRRGTVDPAARLGNAAQIASEGVVSGLTREKRAIAHELLEGRDDETGRAVRALLDVAPERERAALVRRLRRSLTTIARVGERPDVEAVVLTLFVLSQTVVAIVFVAQALSVVAGHAIDPGSEAHDVLAGAVVRTASWLLALIGASRWRHSRGAALRWLRAAVLVDLLIAQAFAFEDSQFRAVAELPFDLLVWAMVSQRLRDDRVAEASSS